MSDYPSGDLLRQVAAVQHAKTIQSVRDLINSIGTTKAASRGYGTENVTAADFKARLVLGVQKILESGQ